MIKFSTTVTCQYDTPFALYPASEYEKALKWVKECGFDGAEVCISNYNNFDVPNLKKDLDSRGLGCSTISTGQSRTLEDISLIHPDKHAQEKARQRINEHINAASILGSKVTIGLLRGIGDKNYLSVEKNLLIKNLEPCVEYAENKKVTLILEPINRYETALLNSAEQTVSFISEMGNPPNLGILWDVFHANIEDDDFNKSIDLMGGLLKHVHLADSNRFFPGWGHINFKALYHKLESAGFDEYLSFECLNLPSELVVADNSGNFINGLKSISKNRE